MMKRAILKTAVALFLAIGLWASCANADDKLKGVLDAVTGSEAVRGAAAGALSESEMAAGLKEALAQGVQTAVEKLGRTDGFLGDSLVRIPVPEKVDRVAQTARALGQGQYVDEFVVSMNRAAEKAVPEAAEILGNAIRAISVEDAARIVNGPDDAATQYFRKTSESALADRFRPIVADATDSVGVTAAYKSLAAQVGGQAAGETAGESGEETDRQAAGQIGGMLGGIAKAVGVPGLDEMGQGLDLDQYVTNQALDGLFTYIAKEERRIRENPLARSSDLLEKVFGR
ncbi:MAG: DUF4197 domain-containing protein [Thermodesulfobacteriota bacterium]